MQDPNTHHSVHTEASPVQRAQQLLDQTAPLITDLEQKLSQVSESDARDELVADVLSKISQRQAALGLPAESPAVITDSGGKVVAYSVAARALGRDSTNFSAIDCMRRVALAREQFEFGGSDLTLHLIGKPDQFDASGAVYNFAPPNVVFSQVAGGSIPANAPPVCEDYWSEAASARSMQYRDIGIAKINSPDQDSKLTEVELPQAPERLIQEQPAFVGELLEKWRDQRFEVGSDGYIDKDSELIKKLMADLHQAAFQGVEHGGGPFSAAIISPQGLVIAFGVNRVVPNHDALAHGERSAIEQALKALQESAPEGEFPLDLSCCILVTSSINCISCAEQAEFAGIKQIIFDNTKEDIEGNTIFTEGPLRGDYWTLTGMRVEQCRLDDELRMKAFRKFAELINDEPEKSYLVDGSK